MAPASKNLMAPARPITPPPPEETSNDILIFRQKIIEEIIASLNQEPKIQSLELEPSNRSWKEQITKGSNKDDREVIERIRDYVLADIEVKRKAKKEAENIANNLATEGKNAEQLKKQLEEVEQAQGQQSYQDNQSGIDNLKGELAKKMSGEEYCQIIVDTTEKTMTKYNVKPDELDAATKKEWQKLKNGEIKDSGQINEIEKKVIKNVGEKGSEKKLDLLFIEAYAVLKLGGKDKIKKVRDKLNNFMVSTDIYEKSLLARKKNEVEKLLKDLENCSPQKKITSPTKFPQKVFIIAALVLLVSIGLGVIICRQRKKRLKL